MRRGISLAYLHVKRIASQQIDATGVLMGAVVKGDSE